MFFEIPHTTFSNRLRNPYFQPVPIETGRWDSVLYVFNFVMVAGVGFLIMCLRRFAAEVRPRHSQIPEKRVAKTQPLPVLKSRSKLTSLQQKPRPRATQLRWSKTH